MCVYICVYVPVHIIIAYIYITMPRYRHICIYVYTNLHTRIIYMYVCILTLVIYTYKQVYSMCGRPTCQS